MASANYVFHGQNTIYDCGYACLKMICQFHGKQFEYSNIVVGRNGINLNEITKELDRIGFRTTMVRMTTSNLVSLKLLPCIAYLKAKHFVVIYEVGNLVKIADPLKGIIDVDIEEFTLKWLSGQTGIIILIE